MPLVLWVADGIQELGVAPQPADVFGGSGSPAGQAHGSGSARSREYVLDDHLVFPAIPEVEANTNRSPGLTRSPSRTEPVSTESSGQSSSMYSDGACSRRQVGGLTSFSVIFNW